MPQSNIFSPYKTFNGAQSVNRVGTQLDSFSSDRHGQLYSAVYGTPAIGTTAASAGMVFSGANASSASLSVGLTTTYTGLCLSNPAASTVNLAVRNCGFTLIASASVSIGLATGWVSTGVTAHTTAVTGILANYIGGATSAGSVVQPAAAQAKLDAACTLVGTPLYTRQLQGVLTATAGGGNYDLGDAYLIPPGGWIAFVSNAASTGFWGSYTWEELAP